MRITIFFCLFFTTASLSTQSLYERTLNSLPDFYEFLSLPNDARIEGQMEENLVWLEGQFGNRGFQISRLPTEGTDLLLAEFTSIKKNAPTVLFYGHADGQSVDPTKWILAP
ncbi:MAG: acetylornithine deacetylase, partial [Bacteroidota bacterium]